MKFFTLLILLCSIGLLFPSILYAHPHIFIDNTIKIVFNENGMTGIKLNWVFDDMYSQALIYDYDIDENEEFGPEEIETLQVEAFENISEYSYFTHIKIDSKNYEKIYATEFSASIENKKVIYTFFVPCEVHAEKKEKKVEVSIYDETYYTDLFLEDMKSVKFEGGDNLERIYRVKEDMDNTIYYGQVAPQVIILTFKEK